MGIKREMSVFRSTIIAVFTAQDRSIADISRKVDQAIHKTVDCTTCGCMIKQEKAKVIRNVEWYRIRAAFYNWEHMRIIEGGPKPCDKDDKGAQTKTTESYYCGKCYPAAKRKDKQA